MKKFSEFTNEKKNNKLTNSKKVSVSKSVSTSDVQETPVIKEKEVKEPKVCNPKTPIVEEPTMESVNFLGRIAKMDNIPPSKIIKLLESNSISRNKLHFIVTESLNSLVIVKYNTNNDIKLNEFVNIFIGYYMKNEKLKSLFANIDVSGSEQFSIINNIPDVMIGEKKLISVLNDDLTKLLK